MRNRNFCKQRKMPDLRLGLRRSKYSIFTKTTTMLVSVPELQLESSRLHLPNKLAILPLAFSYLRLCLKSRMQIKNALMRLFFAREMQQRNSLVSSLPRKSVFTENFMYPVSPKKHINVQDMRCVQPKTRILQFVF